MKIRWKSIQLLSRKIKFVGLVQLPTRILILLEEDDRYYIYYVVLQDQFSSRFLILYSTILFTTRSFSQDQTTTKIHDRCQQIDKINLKNLCAGRKINYEDQLAKINVTRSM